MLKPLALSCLLIVTVSSCANDPTLAPSDYDTLAARAEREIKRASDLGFLWLNTESYMAQSREAHKAGDDESALRLAQQALDEALLAQKQAAEGAKVKADFTYRQ